MKYNGPSPPKASGVSGYKLMSIFGIWLLKTGPHRYVLIVYKQPRSLNSRVSRNRSRFDIGGFAKKNKLGNPVAGNFFYAENQ